MFFSTASSTPSAKVEPSFIMPWAPPAMFRFMAILPVVAFAAYRRVAAFCAARDT